MIDRVQGLRRQAVQVSRRSEEGKDGRRPTEGAFHSEEALEPINLVLERLERIETTLAVLLEQRTLKEWYSTDEVADLLGRSGYTVREWCRKGQVAAEKSANGRGWIISQDELQRIRNLGPTPEHQVQRRLHG